MHKRLFLPIALSVIGLLLAACGVDPGAGTATPTPGPTNTPTPTPAATPTPSVFDAQCISTLAYASEPIKAVIGKDRVPTAFDSINVGGCDFTKPVVKLIIVLDGPGGRQTAEVVYATPVTNIGFPIPSEVQVPIVSGTLTAGMYTRTVTAYTADGETKVLDMFQDIELVENSDAAQSNLDAAKARWAAQGFQAYRYTARWQCFCVTEWVAPVVVEVRDGAVISVSFAEAEQTGEVPNPERFGTIERMFEHVQNAIDERASSITAEYDATFGHPTNVFIDYHALMADEEQGFTITAFESL